MHQSQPKLRGKRGGNKSGLRVSWCPKLQSWFIALAVLWLIYVVGMIYMAINVHKMDPSQPNNANVNANPHQIVKSPGVKAKVTPPDVPDKSQIASKLHQEMEKRLEESKQKALEEARLVVQKNIKINGPTQGKRQNYMPDPHGHLVKPEALNPMLDGNNNSPQQHQAQQAAQQEEVYVPKERQQVLKAYLEPMGHRKLWNTKPLPPRTTTKEDLTVIPYPKLTSCKRLPEQWPVNEYPDADPFLPWIHDVFPTDDGKFMQFVAQNRLRCNSGTTETEEAFLEMRKPYVSLFQHAPLKRLPPTGSGGSKENRYRLASHEDADPESMATRFICRFRPSGDETFSVFNNDYEWTSFRKSSRNMFATDGRDNKQIHTSQLMFQCPVPDHLVELVRSGASVQDDWATLFVDLIPIRTPPRYGNPLQFLIPRYRDSIPFKYKDPFVADTEWGKHHILPRLEDSGRWENIPICLPSLMAYEPQVLEKTPSTAVQNKDGGDGHGINHHLVSCLWASTGYTTRGNRFAINDGQRRLLEWLTFNKLLGFDHFYIYDNSGAFDNGGTTLQPIADMFPGQVTVIPWPSQVCNNNPNNVDSVGERSSQYAAETSCRLRFGEFVLPIGCFWSVMIILWNAFLMLSCFSPSLFLYFRTACQMDWSI